MHRQALTQAGWIEHPHSRRALRNRGQSALHALHYVESTTKAKPPLAVFTALHQLSPSLYFATRSLLRHLVTRHTTGNDHCQELWSVHKISSRHPTWLLKPSPGPLHSHSLHKHWSTANLAGFHIKRAPTPMQYGTFIMPPATEKISFWARIATGAAGSQRCISFAMPSASLRIAITVTSNPAAGADGSGLLWPRQPRGEPPKYGRKPRSARPNQPVHQINARNSLRQG